MTQLPIADDRDSPVVPASPQSPRRNRQRSTAGVLANPRVRLGAGTAVILVTAIAAGRNRVRRGEATTFRLVNGLPDAFYPPAWIIMQLGTLGAAPAAAAVAWLAGDRRLAGWLLAGGTGADPTFAPAVGLSEIEFCRYVLETCTSAEEALDAVRIARHYYLFHPEHFLVADRSGRAFVYEFAPGHNTEYVTWADGLQVVTNHLLYRYPTAAELPAGDGNGLTYARFRTLTSLFSGTSRHTPGEIAERHAAACSRAAVFTTSPAAIPSPSDGRAPSRTSASPVLTPSRT
jgi:hypothetical protein